MIAQLDLGVAQPDAEAALRVGMVRETGRRLGLSQGDCFCLVLAEDMALPLVTTDYQLAVAATESGLQVMLARAPRWPDAPGFVAT